MSRTAAQIRDRAGNDLGLIRLNGSLQAQDSTRITQGYEEVYADLKKDGLATWASDGSVPDELAPSVIALVCLNCLQTYGVSDKRAARIYAAAGADGSIAKAKIRELVADEYESMSDPADF